MKEMMLVRNKKIIDIFLSVDRLFKTYGIGGLMIEFKDVRLTIPNQPRDKFGRKAPPPRYVPQTETYVDYASEIYGLDGGNMKLVTHATDLMKPYIIRLNKQTMEVETIITAGVDVLSFSVTEIELLSNLLMLYLSEQFDEMIQIKIESSYEELYRTLTGGYSIQDTHGLFVAVQSIFAKALEHELAELKKLDSSHSHTLKLGLDQHGNICSQNISYKELYTEAVRRHQLQIDAMTLPEPNDNGYQMSTIHSMKRRILELEEELAVTEMRAIAAEDQLATSLNELFKAKSEFMTRMKKK